MPGGAAGCRHSETRNDNKSAWELCHLTCHATPHDGLSNTSHSVECEHTICIDRLDCFGCFTLPSVPGFPQVNSQRFGAAKLN